MDKSATECPITKVINVLSDRWTMLILHHLNVGEKRFCELERALDGISTRTLTSKLTSLQKEKLITKSRAGIYATTPRGQGIKIIERAMKKYEKTYL